MNPFSRQADGSSGDDPPTSSARILTKDLRYAEISGSEPSLTSLDVYSPRDSADHPVLIYFHGGGWKEGDKGNVGAKAQFFTDSGYVFISANYRLVPYAEFPAQVRDVAGAIGWTKKSVASYGGEPDIMYLMGSSAGAHLVSLVATDGSHLRTEGLDPSTISGVVSLDTRAYDIPNLMKSLPRGGGRLYREAFGVDPEVWKLASPITHVAKGKGIPPFLIAYTGADHSRREQAGRFGERLRSSGVYVRILPAKDKTHKGINRDFGVVGDSVTKAVQKFLRKTQEARLRKYS